LALAREQQKQNETLLDFVPRTTPAFMRPTHLAPIADILQDVEHRSVRAAVSAPPRHSKTELLLHFIAWYLSKHPEKTIGYASHSAALALSKSRLAREYARRSGVVIKNDTDAVSEWRTTAGGGCLANGVFSSWTGFGVNCLLLDDPYSDRSEADSPLIRSRVRDWYQSVASTRIEPGGSIIVTHTRWHENDLVGWLTEESEERDVYQKINLPALDDNGLALWPERWSVQALKEKRAAVGPFEWSSLYLGSPVARGGEVFRGSPARYEVPSLADSRLIISIDPAGTEGTSSDFTACVVIAVRGYGAEMVADVLEVDRFKLEAAAAAPRLAALRRKYAGASVFIEASRDGKQIVRTLKTIDPTLHFTEVAPFSSKLARSGPAAGAWAEGRIRLPLKAPWLEDFLYEIQRFTGVGDAKDDQVDSLSQAWNEATKTSVFKLSRIRSSRY